MTDKPISEEAKKRACELANAARGTPGYWNVGEVGGKYSPTITAFARFIGSVDEMAREQEAARERSGFKPDGTVADIIALSAPFILPRHDPLEEALRACLKDAYGTCPDEFLGGFRNALTKRGLKIVESEQ